MFAILDLLLASIKKFKMVDVLVFYVNNPQREGDGDASGARGSAAGRVPVAGAAAPRTHCCRQVPPRAAAAARAARAAAARRLPARCEW